MRLKKYLQLYYEYEHVLSISLIIVWTYLFTLVLRLRNEIGRLLIPRAFFVSVINVEVVTNKCYWCWDHFWWMLLMLKLLSMNVIDPMSLSVGVINMSRLFPIRDIHVKVIFDKCWDWGHVRYVWLMSKCLLISA